MPASTKRSGRPLIFRSGTLNWAEVFPQQLAPFKRPIFLQMGDSCNLNTNAYVSFFFFLLRLMPFYRCSQMKTACTSYINTLAFASKFSIPFTLRLVASHRTARASCHQPWQSSVITSTLIQFGAKTGVESMLIRWCLHPRRGCICTGKCLTLWLCTQRGGKQPPPENNSIRVSPRLSF